MRRLIVCAMVALALAIAAAVFRTPARGHSFYAPECCSGQDCAPLPAEAVVQQVPGGWNVTRSPGEAPIFFTRDKMRPSPDGAWHACVGSTGTGFCLYLPTEA